MKIIKNIIKYTLFLSLACTKLALAQSRTSHIDATTKMGTESVIVEPSRAEFFAFAKVKDHETGDINVSHFYQPLNQNWKFKIFSNASQIGKDVVSANYNDASWSGYNIGRNLLTDSKIKDQKGKFNPEIAIENSTVVYRTNFKVPMTWDEREVFVSFNRLSGLSTIYVNGKEIGRSEDSRAVNSFNATKSVHEGINSLVVVSSAYSVASYLEDGDLFAGLQIGGDVTVWSAPKVQLYDYISTTQFDPTYTNGMLEFRAIIRTHYLNPSQVRLFFELKDAEGRVIDSQRKYSKVKMQDSDTIYFNVPIANVNKWSAADPYLYSANIKVQREMRFTEIADFNVGFRTVEVEGNNIKINGKTEKLVGVRLSQNDIPKEKDQIIALLSRIKESGINSLWISGVQDRTFYNEVDKIGLYIINSANINSSQTSSNLQYSTANDRFLVNKYRSRVTSLVESARNYPSVAIFALGNDGGNGYNMYESYIEAKRYAQHQPIVYMGASREWNSDIYLAKSMNTKELERYNYKLELPTIVMDMDNRDIKQRWQAIDKNDKISGFIFKNISVLNDQNISSKLSRLEFSYNEGEIKITNLRSKALKELTLRVDLIQKKSIDNRSITNDGFTIESNDQFCYSLNTKELKGEVNRATEVRCTLFDGKGDILHKETFKIYRERWLDLGI